MCVVTPNAAEPSYSESHRAGQVAQPYGVCFTSNTKSPVLYWFLDSSRTEKRPVEALGDELGPTVVSTLTTAVLDVAYVRFYRRVVSCERETRHGMPGNRT
jgi:hypothetical protein